MLLIPTPRKPGDEWKAVVQARIYIARKKQSLKMAMTEVLEVGNNAPLELHVEPDIENIKIELRFIYQVSENAVIHNPITTLFSSL
jgi:hypothetical protein